jgi:hypothetical protein
MYTTRGCCCTFPLTVLHPSSLPHVAGKAWDVERFSDQEVVVSTALPDTGKK